MKQNKPKGKFLYCILSFFLIIGEKLKKLFLFLWKKKWFPYVAVAVLLVLWFLLAGASSQSGGGSSGGSSYGGIGGYEPYVPDHSKLNCLTCGGDGDCNSCGGTGRDYYGDYKTKCNTCHGSGNCRTCGGSGKR